MATLNFRLQSTKENTSIYINLSLGRGKQYKRKTGYSIDFKDWSVKTSYPKQNNPHNKNLKTNLDALKNHIEVQLNEDNKVGVDIDGNWLGDCIDEYLGNTPTKELEYLAEYTQYYIDNLKYIVNKRGGQGVSESTVKKRKTIQRKLVKFELLQKKRFKIKDVDLDFRL